MLIFLDNASNIISEIHKVYYLLSPKYINNFAPQQ